MDNITLFSIITIMSFFLLFPVTYFMEGFKYAPSYLQSAVSVLFKDKKFAKLRLFFSHSNIADADVSS